MKLEAFPAGGHAAISLWVLALHRGTAWAGPREDAPFGVNNKGLIL